MTTFRKGFAFLGFDLAAWSVKMRPKSVEKFKDKIRELTPRQQNLDAQVVKKINQRTTDNWRLRLKHLRRQGLLSLSEIRAPPVKELLARPKARATTAAPPGA